MSGSQSKGRLVCSTRFSSPTASSATEANTLAGITSLPTSPSMRSKPKTRTKPTAALFLYSSQGTHVRCKEVCTRKTGWAEMLLIVVVVLEENAGLGKSSLLFVPRCLFRRYPE